MTTRNSGLVLLLGMAAHVASAQQPPLRIDVERLRPDVYVFSGFTNGNVIAIVGDTAVLLVDAQSARRVGSLDSALKSISGKPVRVVINTHYHGDHTEGNAYFRGNGAQVVAHRNVGIQAAKDTTIAEMDTWHRTPLAAAAMPTREFGDSLAFRFGTHRVVALHAPMSHTDGDAIVWFPDANVLHIGDILEMGAPPFIDWWVGGTLDGMVRSVDRVLALTNSQTAIVPGHGRVSTQEDLRKYRAMLVTVGARVRSRIRESKPLDAVLADKPAAEFTESLGGTRGADRFVRVVYLGMSRFDHR